MSTAIPIDTKITGSELKVEFTREPDTEEEEEDWDETCDAQMRTKWKPDSDETQIRRFKRDIRNAVQGWKKVSYTRNKRISIEANAKFPDDSKAACSYSTKQMNLPEIQAMRRLVGTIEDMETTMSQLEASTDCTIIVPSWVTIPLLAKWMLEKTHERTCTKFEAVYYF